MRLELKNVRVSHALSDETLAFSATVYLDGKRVSTVQNRGHGGCHEYGKLDVAIDLEDAAKRWCAANLSWWEDGFSEAFDAIITELAQHAQDAKRLKRLLKKNVLVRLPEHGENEMLVFKITERWNREMVTAHINAKYPNATFLGDETIPAQHADLEV